ncbi:MAG: signal peptidase II [Anaerolineae bacterium]|nr:signal peptidase II [Anaerolineae bacterium]
MSDSLPSLMVARPSARHWLALVGLIGGVLLIDQASKLLIIDRVAVGQMVVPIPALREVFRIIHSQNTGAAFGMFSGAGDVFSVIAVVVSILMLVMHHRSSAGAWGQRIGFGLVIGGALGNAIDRVMYGHVVDFINYRIPGVISNVSNLADHAIVAGVLVLLWLSWRPTRAQPESTPTA